MDKIAPELLTLAVPLDSIQQHPHNPRQGDLATISASLDHHGQYKPVVVQASTGWICAGNHTWLAARQLGWERIAAVSLDIDQDTATKILLMDNKSSEGGGYDDTALAQLLESVQDDLDATGYDHDELDDLLAALGNGAPLVYEALDGSPPVRAVTTPLAPFADPLAALNDPATYAVPGAAVVRDPFAVEDGQPVGESGPNAYGAPAVVLGAPPAYNPAPTFTPTYNETEQEEAARRAALEKYETRAKANLAEVIMVMPADDRAELLRLFARLREVVGKDSTQAQLALTCARVACAVVDGAAGHKGDCTCTWCAVAREAGAVAAKTTAGAAA